MTILSSAIKYSEKGNKFYFRRLFYTFRYRFYPGMENLTSKLELNYYFENIKRSVFLGIFFLLGFFTFSLIIKSMKQIISLILVTFYFIIRFSFDFFGIELPSYGGYFIDLIAIFLVILINLKSFFAKPIWKFSLIFYTLANLFLGIGIFQIGKFLNYLPPF